MEVRPLAVEMTPLTPLWTGDADKKGNRILETGILGSLRWWYEAILRGLGFQVCDLGQKACLYDRKKGRSSLCPACQLFGCTGYSRRFRLIINGNKGGHADELLDIKPSNPGSNRYFGWRIPGGIAGPLQLSFLPMSPDGLREAEKASLYYVLHLAERWGALGAKTSQGQGVIQVKNWGEKLQKPMAFDKWYEVLSENNHLEQEAEERATGVQATLPEKATLPDIRNFVGATIILEDTELTSEEIWPKLHLKASYVANSRPWSPVAVTDWLPSAPAVRAQLRAWLRDKNNFSGLNDKMLASERHRIMGTTNSPWGDSYPVANAKSRKDRPKGSEVFVTHLYRNNDQQWVMRIFGFIPREGNEVDKELRELLRDTSRLKTEVQAALGGLPVKIDPYPTDIKLLLTDGGKG